MLDRLNVFDRGQIPVDKLINDLEGLLNALQGIEFSWKQTFLRFWGKIEDERAFALSEGSSVLNEQATASVHAAVGQLRLLVLEKIDDPVDRSAI
jgi:hypothetical protein